MNKTFMAFCWVALLSATTLWMPLTASAAIICVGPSASGSGSGADWSNLKAWSGTPVRGDTWYLVDGAYTGKSLGVAASGSTLITIKKAIESDHGSSTGWSSTYGDGQATFSGKIEFTTSYWVFDGQTGGGPGSWNSGFGFKVTETADGAAVLLVGYSTSANYITIRHVDLQGKGSVSTQGGYASNDGLAIYGDNNVTLSYFWMHGIGRCPFFISTGNLIVEYGWVQSFYGSSAVHSEVASIWSFAGGIGDVTFRYNLFTDIKSTGGLMWDNSSNPSAHMYVYGNVFYKPSGANWEQANGIIGGWTGGGGEQFHNCWVYNNTFINCDQETLSTFPNTSSGGQAKNNLWYNCNSPSFSKFPTHDNNHFINSGGSHSEANGTSATSGDPLVNFVGLDFGLKANTSPGANLGSPYNIDPTGKTRSTWSRGAYEFGTPNPNPVISVTPTALSFGSIITNTSRDLSFTVQNVGAGTLAGTASVAAPFSIISGGTYSLAANQSQSVTVRYSPTVAGNNSQNVTFTGGGGINKTVSGLAAITNLPAVGGGLGFEAELGIISAPFVSASGHIYQQSTTDFASGGRAVYSFTVTNAGDYVIQALVNAPSLTENSFYLNIDAEPQDPTMACDILPPTVGFENRLVSWRGNGTADTNEIVRKIFNLTQGTHQLIIRGREANAQLDRFELVRLLSPPSNLFARPATP